MEGWCVRWLPVVPQVVVARQEGPPVEPQRGQPVEPGPPVEPQQVLEPLDLRDAVV